jgi:hypothetical protein
MCATAALAFLIVNGLAQEPIGALEGQISDAAPAATRC